MEYLEQVIKKVKPTLSPTTFKKYISNINTILNRALGIDRKMYDAYYKNLDLWLYEKDKILDFISDLSVQSKKNYYSTLITLLSSTEKDNKFMKEVIKLQKNNVKNIKIEQQENLGNKDIDKTITKIEFDKFLDKLDKNIYREQEYILFKILWHLPFRNELGILQYTTTKDFNKLTEPQKDDRNFLIVNSKEIYIYRSKYKTKKTYGKIQVKLVDKELKSTLRQYVKKYKFKSGDYIFNPVENRKQLNFTVGLDSNNITNILGNASRAILNRPLTETNIFKSVLTHNMDKLSNIDDKRKFLENKSIIRGTNLQDLLHYYLMPKQNDLEIES
jgi:hypothetical protein